MSVSARALWYIESHLDGDLSLDEIAASSAVSRFHLSRAFSLTVVHTIAGYARARRLSEAAKALAAGAPDILTIALAASYGSHEAFTRAFVAQFGATPEQVRARASVAELSLQEPIRMQQPGIPLEPPRIVKSEPLRIVGLAERYAGSNAGIPAQWGRFNAYGAIPGQLGSVVYGVVHEFDDAGGFTYVCGVPVKEFPTRLGELVRVELPRAPTRCGRIANTSRACSRPASAFTSTASPAPASSPSRRRCSNAMARSSIRAQGTAGSRSGCR